MTDKDKEILSEILNQICDDIYGEYNNEHLWTFAEIKSLISPTNESSKKYNYTYVFPTDLNEREKYYILKYNSLRPNGYNILEGGNNEHQKGMEEIEYWKRVKKEDANKDTKGELK